MIRSRGIDDTGGQMNLRDEIAKILADWYANEEGYQTGADLILTLPVEIIEICTSDNRKENCAEHMGREECTLQAPTDGIRRCKGALKRIVPLREVIEGKARKV